MTPTIGRIVIYNHPGSADGKYPPSQSPAIIQNVAPDGSVTLFVMGPKGQHQDSGLTQGDGPCQWNWPDYTAAKEISSFTKTVRQGL